MGGGLLEVGIGDGGGSIEVVNDNVQELGVHGDERVEISDKNRGTQNFSISILVDLVFIFDKLKGDERVGIDDGTWGTRNWPMFMLVDLIFVFDKLKE